jgi:hypothetical protein
MDTIKFFHVGKMMKIYKTLLKNVLIYGGVNGAFIKKSHYI